MLILGSTLRSVERVLDMALDKASGGVLMRADAIHWHMHMHIHAMKKERALIMCPWIKVHVPHREKENACLVCTRLVLLYTEELHPSRPPLEWPCTGSKPTRDGLRKKRREY